MRGRFVASLISKINGRLLVNWNQREWVPGQTLSIWLIGVHGNKKKKKKKGGWGGGGEDRLGKKMSMNIIQKKYLKKDQKYI